MRDPSVGRSQLDTVTLPAWSRIESAQRAIEGTAIVTPVVELPIAGAGRLDVKLENLQPTGSFKIRGTTAALVLRRDERDGPLVTVSAGNTGRAVAYLAARSGRSCVVYVPDHAPQAKLEPIRKLGAVIEPLPFDQWWAMAQSTRRVREDEVFIHPFCDPDVIAGNATIGSELAGRAAYDSVLVPWGGGGLALGIATALRTVVVTVSPQQAAEGVRLAAQAAQVIVEGAAGCAIAAASRPEFRDQRVLAIASGGNLDAGKLAIILNGGTP